MPPRSTRRANTARRRASVPAHTRGRGGGKKSVLTVRDPGGGKHGGYGWVPDLPDHRDFLFAPDPTALKKLATTTHFDLTAAREMPPVWDQGQLGSCTAHSVGAAFAFASKKSHERRARFDPSRLWIYYQERLIEGTVGQDAGAMIRDGFKVCANVGVAPTSDWPYDIATFTTPPSSKAGADALKHQSLIYRAVRQDLTSIKAGLVGGYPVSFGFSVYESFESAQVASTGVVPMPSTSEGLLGGHAVLIVGFDDPSQRFIVRNSWGTSWGKGGMFTMPYAYILDPNLSDDFWQVSVTE